MSYVDAGYAIVLSVLALYSVQLVWRRRRLARVVARLRAEGGGASGPEQQVS
ncbi:MAG: hypothetical protein M0032_03475 [Actinomycetota bacterium]|jgi:heme exporter protein D|nr:hypothetical protein [Actinomycetota bacterium]MDA8294650.1 hypothetical protein [Actinomycetota bacterium]